MRILIVGKFPPIQGGVSTQTFWTAHRLADLGHQVHVVTNAEAVDYGFHQMLFGADRELLAGTHAHGEVHVHATCPLRAESYIPWAPPFGSQLFGRAAEVLAEQTFDAVLGWYFEPYGLVAAQAATAFGTPLLLRHAGSDIGRLARHPDLASAYRWMAQQCTTLFTGGGDRAVADALSHLGFSAEQRVRTLAAPLPSVYTERAAPLNLDALPATIESWIAAARLDPVAAELASTLNSGAHDPTRPTVGIYGKVGEAKGTYDLLEALEQVAAAGTSFNFLAAAAGRPRELRRFSRAVLATRHLSRVTWVLPPLAPWRIPSLLACCDVACVLERDFPIPFHHCSSPREILAAGRCLICSDEVARKLPFAASLVDGKNCVLVGDPRDRYALTAALAGVLDDGVHRRDIAHHGRYLSEFWEGELEDATGLAGQLDERLRTIAAARPRGSAAQGGRRLESG